MKSKMQKKDGRCYLCMKLHSSERIHATLHEHHIFGGPNRSLSEAEGLKVYLCIGHHINGPEAVHNNIQNMRLLQQDGQQVFEETHTREEFMQKFGRNYID